MLTWLIRLVLVGRDDGTRARFRERLCGWHEAEAPPPQEGQPRPSERTVDVEGFVRVASADELPAGEVMEVRVGDATVALANVDGAFHAVANACPHAGGPLGDGTLEGATLTCPYHGWSFDVSQGTCLVDAESSVEVFEVRVEGGAVYVRVGDRV
jgi:nitrite reductase (NADH) small subunit